MSYCGFQRRLNEAKERSGMSDYEIAAAVNRDRKAVGKWRRGENCPNAESLYAICVALGVSADWLLGLEVKS